MGLLLALTLSLTLDAPVAAQTPARAPAAPTPRPLCNAEDATANTPQPRKYSTYDWVPVVPDGSSGFHVVYSVRNASCQSVPGNNVTISVFSLGGSRVLVFGSGYGTDPFPGQGGCGWPLFDADHDAALVDEVLTACIGIDGAADVELVVPHGHVDHVNPAFVAALRAEGHTVVGIWFHEGDAALVAALPGWTAADTAVFRPLFGSACSPLDDGGAPFAFQAPAGRVWFLSRPGHTPGSIDLVLDVGGDPAVRYRMLGSAPSGACLPSGVVQTFNAHGNVVFP